MTPPINAPHETEPPDLVGAAADESVGADDALQEQLGEFHRDVAAELGGAVDAMDAQVKGLRAVLDDAATRHQRSFDQLIDAAGPADAWNAARVYQQDVVETVIARLKAHLGSSRPDETTHDVIRECIEQVQTRATQLPTTALLPDATSIYEVVTTDSVGDRMRKRLKRATRRLKKMRGAFRLGRNRSQSLFDARRVDLAFLVSYHIQVRLTHVLGEQYGHTQQTLASALANVGDALNRWYQEQLAVEHTLDRVPFHRQAQLPSVAISGDDDGPSRPRTTDAVERARTNASKLQDALVEAVASLDTTTGTWSDQLARVVTEFDQDIRQAGTFLLPRRDRRVPRASRTPSFQLDQSARRWRVWHGKVLARLNAIAHVIMLRASLLDIEEKLLVRLFEATLGPVDKAFERIKKGLDQAIDETTNACDAHSADQSNTTLARRLQDIQKSTLERLRTVFRDVPGIVHANEALTDPGRAEWHEMLSLIEQLPEKLIVHRPRIDVGMGWSLPAPSFAIDLRGIARDAIDPPLPDQLVKSSTPLMQRIVKVWDDAVRVEDIVRFNMGATLDELSGDVEHTDTSDNQSAVDRARQLAIEALQRSQETLDDLSASLVGPWHALELAVFESYQNDWADVLRRLRSEGAVEERLVGFKTRITRTAKRLWREAKAFFSRTTSRVRLLSANTVRAGRRIIARGHAVVGTKEVADDESTTTLDTIVDVAAMQARLPLVYRKLFSFEPLTDSSLLEGRTRDLVRVRQHFERWKSRHNAGVLILSSRIGDGRTTFLNVLREKVFAECDIRFGSIDHRMRTEDEFANYLGKLLDIDGSSGDLATLHQQLTSMERTDQPLVCMLDNLEHLVLQGTGTNELIERVLMFFSRTDRHVFWIATIGHEAWRFTDKTTGSATGFVTHYTLTTLDRATIEELIFTRHRRSGIPVVFAEPKSPSAILRQRLRRARTEERKQEILRKEFFDALFATAEQDIRLALFYWINSADFEARTDELVIRPFVPLAFNFLKKFDQLKSFTLKAFVIHNTLRLEEHRSIFRLPEDESVFILESLLNDRLIEPVYSDNHPRERDDGILPGQAYRVRRLALNPVIKHLRDKHFIY